MAQPADQEVSAPVTSRDIAVRAGVSIGTVFRVLQNRSNVAPELRQRVQEAMAELGYTYMPRRRLNNVPRDEDSAPQLRTVMMCIHENKQQAAQHAYFYQVLQGVDAACADNNLTLIYTRVDDTPTALPQALSVTTRSHVDGIILVNYESVPFINALLDIHVPVVVLDPRYEGNLPVDVITFDAAEGTSLAVQHLLKLGHRQIALLNGPKRPVHQLRLDAYRNTLARAGIEFHPQLVGIGELTIAGGEQAITSLLTREVPFTALICANDYMAVAAMRVLQASGRRVPEDVSVIGFDNFEMAQMTTPTLTTIDLHHAMRGKMAVQRLLDRLARPDELYGRLLTQVNLIERQSAQPLLAGD
jgi:DNA-binding LacI/PurR family transcriptional regulator